MPPTPDLSYTGLDEFVNKTIVENKSCKEETKSVRKDDLIIEEWVSDDEIFESIWRKNTYLGLNSGKTGQNTTLQAFDFRYDAFPKNTQKVKFIIKVVTSQVVETA
nr:hypothetical protein [Tanacetum cinerariifolium]